MHERFGVIFEPPEASILKTDKYPQIEVVDISKEPLRFVSQTKFQQMLFSVLRTIRHRGKGFGISQDQLES